MSDLSLEKVRAFYFSAAQLTPAEKIDASTKGLGQFARAVRKQTPPFVKIIRPSGAVKPLA